MNFLSHYYFDRHITSCYYVLGTVLPDLLKNADKTIILHPQKQHFATDTAVQIYMGWQKHLLVDRHFHNSGFFKTHSHQLKLQLRPAIEGSPVKPFFLGHIALELILDSLLLTTQTVNADEFYNHLGLCHTPAIDTFLISSGMQNTVTFTNFFDNFKQNKYLHTYAQTQQVAYALKRICMRVWSNPFTPQQEAAINGVIISYRNQLKNNFMQIFDEIDEKVKGER